MDENAFLIRDIRKPWLQVARRLQSVSRSQGLSLVTITILCDQEGNPRFWLEPVVRKIEPSRSADEILAIFAKDGHRSEFIG